MTGKWEGCQDAGIAPLLFSQGIALTTPTTAILEIGTKTFAYVTNSASTGSNAVYQCLINPKTGLFKTCVPSGGGAFTNPYGIAINKALNGNIYAYVITTPSSSTSTASVSKCLINSKNGQFSACNTLSTPTLFFSDTGAIVFNTVGNQTYVYIPNDASTTTVLYCAVNSSGDFSNCQTTTNSTFSEPYNIAFALINGQSYAYVSNADNGIVSKCVVNSVNGDLINCVPTFYTEDEGPMSLATLLIHNQWYFYMGSYIGYYDVLQCSINSSTENLQNCSDSGVGGIFYYPQNIVFAEI